MNFEECFDKVFEEIDFLEQKKGNKFAVSPQTAKILTLAWNIERVRENKLDELVFIENNNIVKIKDMKDLFKKLEKEREEARKRAESQEQVELNINEVLDKWMEEKKVKIEKEIEIDAYEKLLKKAEKDTGIEIEDDDFSDWLEGKGSSILLENKNDPEE